MIDCMKVAFIAALKPFNFALWALLIVVLGVAGPFGTFELIPFDERLRYWGLIVVISALMGYQASFFSETLTTGKHPILTDLLTTLLLALFLTPVNLWITHWLVVPDLPDEGPRFVDMAIYVSAVSFALMTSRRLIPGLEEQNYLPDTQDDTIPRLMRRLPDRVQTQILRISSEGHFVEICP
ncbi:MAG: hypothetical protein WAO69_09785 [Aestuariivita sp.]|uniref:hypothetical protein n=1 Tax=Aestuariivita sp. TaxID=1872407 RepID=UPI003BAF9951